METPRDTLYTPEPNAPDRLRDAFGGARGVVVGLLAVGAAFAFNASPARAQAANLVPGQGIDGINIGDTQPQVEQILGPDTPSRFSSDNTGSWGSNLFYPKAPLEGAVSLNAQGQVIDISTGSRQFRTSKDIGIGSTLKQMRKAYPKTKCETMGKNTRCPAPNSVL